MSKEQSRLSVDQAFAGLRLDLFLARQHPDISRRRWKDLIATGDILVNGHRADKDLALQPGWIVEINIADQTPLDTSMANSKLAARIPLLYQDDCFLAVDKPAGIPTHPLQADEHDTLFNALLAIDPAIALAGPKALEGGLVHRLDIQTSGIVLAARTPECFNRLGDIFASHAAEKTYIAIVVGTISHDRDIRLAIAHHARKGNRMVAIGPDANSGSATEYRGVPRPAISRIRVLQNLDGHTLVEVRVRQAQMHQIRVHLQAIGHPLAADAIYHPPRELEIVDSGMLRHALHAYKIELPHPITDQPLLIKAPLPPDMLTAITHLGGTWPA